MATGNGAGSGEGKEFNVPIILNADAATLGFGSAQVTGTVDSAPLDYSVLRGISYFTGTSPTGPNDMSSGQVIVE